MVKKTVLLDLFGTLIGATSPELKIIDTFSLNPKEHNRLQRVVCGIDFYNQCHGKIKEYLNAVMKEANINEDSKNLEEIKNIYEEEINRANLFPETKSVLNNLKSRGYQLGLISNAYPLTRQRLLNRNELTQYFDKILLSYEVGMTKQMPTFYQLALSQLAINAEDTVMVGDSLKGDILASKNATNNKIGGILIAQKNPSVSLERFLVVKSLSLIPEVVESLFK